MPIVLRAVRATVAAAIVIGLVAQFVHGNDRPTFQAVNFFSYFTVLSNLAAVGVLGALAVRPALLASEPFTIYRGATTLYMGITGLIYATLLAPQAADVSVNLKWVDVIVHVIAPAVIVADWFIARSPIRPTVAQTATWMIFPAVWLIYTLVRGRMADWYPYPFLDPGLESVGSIVVTCVGILAVFVAVAALLRWWSGARPVMITAS